MRLLKLNNHGGFSLETFPATDIPSYAILSHTWGREDQEVTLKDLIDGTGGNKEGYQKLRFCGNQAKADDLHYFWVDTCCIDKSNNNELTKAINSMFRWYQNAAKCYVYLSDVRVRTQDGRILPSGWELAFGKSRWFTRGWTLQELVAPKIVDFYSRDYVRVGDKKTLEREIVDITGITKEALRGHSLSDFGIDERFRWAEKRQTTEEEDKAYCLLGIFDIYLPLIYGEGHSSAIRRLLRELRESASTRPQLTNRNLLSGTKLLEAAKKGDAIQVKQLLDEGTDVDFKDKDNRTPLLCAAKEGYETVVMLLLATGNAQVDSKDRDGRTPLSCAAAYGHEGIIKLLLETSKVDINSKDKYNQTPLLWATKGGYETVVELLLATGKVEVDSKDNARRTPLSWAAAYGQEGIVKLLLETGKADLNSKGGGGNTPLMWAIEHKHEAIENLMRSYISIL